MESWHPLVVHFPIALLVTASSLDALALLARKPGIHRVATWNLVLGICSAVLAAGSGLLAEERAARHSFEIWQVLERHKRLAFLTLGLGSAALAWRWTARAWPEPRWRWVAAAWTLAAAGSVAGAAYFGGRLVYDFGVGGTFGANP